MPQDQIIAAMLTAALDRDANGQLTPKAKVDIAALRKIAGDPDLAKELAEEISGEGK